MGYDDARAAGDYAMDGWACLTMDAQTTYPITSHLKPKTIEEILRDL